MSALSNSDVDLVLALYPASRFACPTDRLVRLRSDSDTTTRLFREPRETGPTTRKEAEAKPTIPAVKKSSVRHAQLSLLQLSSCSLSISVHLAKRSSALSGP